MSFLRIRIFSSYRKRDTVSTVRLYYYTTFANSVDIVFEQRSIKSSTATTTVAFNKKGTYGRLLRRQTSITPTGFIPRVP